MNIAMWDPFREMESLVDRYNRSRYRLSNAEKDGSEKMAVSDWNPLVDVSEDAAAYHIHSELPGVNKDDMQLSVDNQILSIRGKRESKHEEKDKKFHRVERSYGTFSRSFSLPEEADVENIQANFKDGILEVVIPKTERKKVKAIAVN